MTARVLVAMSGGVDSSVAAALLLEQGYDVVGVTMRLWSAPDGELPPQAHSCCSVEDVDDARRAAQLLDIPFYLLNFEREFQECVVDYFCREYTRGRTPNPCLACNRYVKFRHLLGRARQLGCDYLATGHYGRIRRRGGGFRLLRGVDARKDQSYVLYTLGQQELARLLLPVGELTKEEVRAKARSLGLRNAEKPDSQEICFVVEDDYRRFLDERGAPRPGPIVDTTGRLLGQHSGLAHYTVGQRRGLGLGGGERRYVVSIDTEANRLVVGGEQDLLSEGLLAEDVHYVAGDPPAGPLTVAAQLRYRAAPVVARLHPCGDRARLEFERPQRGVTPGQAVVWYRGEEVVGGGTIVG